MANSLLILPCVFNGYMVFKSLKFQPMLSNLRLWLTMTQLPRSYWGEVIVLTYTLTNQGIHGQHWGGFICPYLIGHEIYDATWLWVCLLLKLVSFVELIPLIYGALNVR